jgi:hypothetical protein
LIDETKVDHAPVACQLEQPTLTLADPASREVVDGGQGLGSELVVGNAETLARPTIEFSS